LRVSEPRPEEAVDARGFTRSRETLLAASEPRA
jgi:hypothetical protein